MDFKGLVAENIRLTILRALEQDQGGSHNESVLHSIVVEFGFRCSRDCVRTELAWLREQGLVTLKEVADRYVAEITGRGIDVAQGLAQVPGVARPRPS